MRADGATIEVLLTPAFVEPGDAEPYVFSQLQDVTEQRRAQRQKAAIAELLADGQMRLAASSSDAHADRDAA